MRTKERKPPPRTRARIKAGKRQDLAVPPGWLLLAIVSIIYVLVRVSAVGIPLDRDEGTFAYAGARILEGGRVYIDIIDHKPPGVFYLFALALRLFSPTAQGLHWFLHTYNFLTLLGVWLLMKAQFPSSPWAPFWGALCFAVFSASPAIQGFTASTEMLMLLPIVFSVLAAVEATKKPKVWLLLLSGALGAAAFWIKQTALTSVAFGLLYLIADAWRKNRVEALKRLMWWTAGAAMVSLMTGGYFLAKGIFSQSIYWSFTHNFVYAAQVPISENLSRWTRAMGSILSADFLVIGLGLGAAIWNIRQRKQESLFALGFIAFSAAGTLPGFSYPHYFAQLAPAVAVAGGWALAIMAEAGTVRSRHAVLAVVFILVAVPVFISSDYFLQRQPELISRHYAGESPFPESAELGQYLAQHTAPEDRIFIFGSEPEILVLANRKSATPFIMIYPLTREYPRYLEFQDRVWNDVVNNTPAYILVVNIPASVLWDGHADLGIQRHLEELIRNHYRLEAVMPVESPKGKLVVLSQGESAPAGVDVGIFLYHRIAN